MPTPPPRSRRFDWFRVLRRRWRGDAGAPPWCRGCGYSVRGLTGRSCPECGARFSVVGVLDPAVVKVQWWKPVSAVWLAVIVVAAVMLTERLLPWLPGQYSGSFNLHLWGTAGRSPFWFRVVIEGERRSWYRRRPDAMAYERVRMRIGTFTPVDREIEVELPSLVYRDAAGEGVLTEALLAGWLVPDGQSVDANLRRHVREVLAHLQAASDGGLPWAGHPGTYLPTVGDTAVLHHRWRCETDEPMRVTVFLAWAAVGLMGVYLFRDWNRRLMG